MLFQFRLIRAVPDPWRYLTRYNERALYRLQFILNMESNVLREWIYVHSTWWEKAITQAIFDGY